MSPTDSPLEDEPPSAATVFGDRIRLALRYAELLAGPGRQRGLIGPREAGRLWSRHLLNCAVLSELVPAGASVVDIGSGAGLPGIPLVLAHPDCTVDMLEPLLRRSIFLEQAVAELGLHDRCRVVRVRAEDAVGTVGAADVVTARAVAPLAKLAAWAAPLIRPGGALLAIKGSSAGDEIARDRVAVSACGITDLTLRAVGTGVIPEPATVVVGRRTADRRRHGRAAPRR